TIRAMESELDRLIYDWNRDGRAARADYRAVELEDATLRDGLQGPSVRNPPLDVRKRLLSLMDQLGIDSADIGLPGASPQARASIVALAKETTRLGRLKPNCAIRTHPDDVRGAIEASTEAGVPIQCCAFIRRAHRDIARGSRAWMRPRHRRARRQYLDGSAPHKPAALGIDRARSHAARRVHSARRGALRYPDPTQLPGDGRRRVPDGNGRARG